MAASLRRIQKVIEFGVLRRNIVTSAFRMEKAMENLKTNPYFEKYADRIAALQNTSPEEFMERVEHAAKAKEEEKKRKFGSVDTRQFSSVLNPKEKTAPGAGAGADKKLDEIFKLELVEDKSAEEIQAIWEEYHKKKEVISATIPTELYKSIKEVIKNNPTFLFPLPREQGYEFVMCQSSGNTVHFTPLLAYQVHKENAPECLTMVHYTELSSKGLVLMRGEYDKNVLNGKEAQCLANQFQMYYNGIDKEKHELLKTFTRSPDSFKHMELIKQLENISLV